MVNHVGLAAYNAVENGFRQFDPEREDIQDYLRAKIAFVGRAVIAAMRSPTAAMLEAGSDAMKGREISGDAKFSTLQVGYLAMLDAALADDEKAVTP